MAPLQAQLARRLGVKKGTIVARYPSEGTERRLEIAALQGERVERGGLAIAAEAFVLLLEPLVLLLEQRVLALELEAAIEQQRERGGGRARARPRLDAARWGGRVVGVAGRGEG